MVKNFVTYLLSVMTAVAIMSFPFETRFGWDNLETRNEYIDKTHFALGKKGGRDSCSGTLIDHEEGLILTAAHCLALYKVYDKETKTIKMGDIIVRQRSFSNYVETTNYEWEASLVASNSDLDLAVLKIDVPTHHTVSATIDPSPDLVRGEEVYAVGNPIAEYLTVTKGIVSALDRVITVGTEKKFFQFSSGAYGGSSGGAIYDSDGKLVGVISAGHPRATFMSFAVSSDIVWKFLKDNNIY